MKVPNSDLENEEIIAYIQFYNEIKKVTIPPSYEALQEKLSTMLELNSDLTSTLIISYKDEDNDNVMVNSNEDYLILLEQIKNKQVNIINIEKNENSNINIDECSQNFTKFKDKIDINDKANNIKNFDIVSSQLEINKQENKDDKNNQIIINNNVREIKNEIEINNNKEISNNIDNDLNNSNSEEDILSPYNQKEQNINNKVTINQINDVNIINNNININANVNLSQRYLVFNLPCGLCNNYPILKILYYCPTCSVYICPDCEKKPDINHRHSILKVQTQQQYEDLNEKIKQSNEELNLENAANQSTFKNIKDSVLNLFKGNKEENVSPKRQNLPQQMSLIQIADIVDQKIESIKLQYIEDVVEESQQAGEGIVELIKGFQENPEAGVSLYGPLINTVTRGARLKKFYLRSAATGVGKTRSLIADACYISCNKMYDENFGWIKTGPTQPTLFIATEQDLSEIQTMMLAFLANVNEEHIIDGHFDGDEEERVMEAAKILQDAPLYVELLPDFSLQDVENRIKKNIRDHDIRYCFMDYIHTSMKILEEITRRSGGIKLREDNILFMLSNKLKDICNQYGIFIMSATQLNSDYQDSETPDQNLLRGAKSIADKIDFGSILLLVKDKDIKGLEKVLANSSFDTPTIKLSVYKNRRGRYKGIYLWCKSDLGTCRIKPMFATGWDYELIPIDDTRIYIASAFPEEYSKGDKIDV